MNSLQVLGLRLGNAKAAIQRPNAPSSRAAPSTKGSNAQIATFAKFGPFADSGLSCRLRRRSGQSPNLLMLQLVQMSAIVIENK